MHDSAPCHRSKLVKNYLQEKNVDALDWPRNSPDMCPIYNMWHVMKTQVANQLFFRIELLKIMAQLISSE